MPWIWRRLTTAWPPNLDWLMLVAALVVFSGSWAFVELADEVGEGSTLDLDRQLLLVLRSRDDPGDPLGPPWLEDAVRDITALGSPIVLLLATVAAVGFLTLTRRYQTAGFMVIATGGGAILTTLLKWWFARPRPEVVPQLMRATSASFPSGHAQQSAVVYLAIGAILAGGINGVRQRVYVLLVAISVTALIGLSRVYLGVHYPTDVLAGWTAGAVWALLCWTVARWLRSVAASRGEAV